MSITTEQAATWFEDRAKNTPMPGAREMFKIAAEALREKAERENPQPLTLEELRQNDMEPFYVHMHFEHNSAVMPPVFYPAILDEVRGENVAVWCGSESCFLPLGAYGVSWIAYRHKPKEVTK